MTITINGSGTITGASTLATAIASPTLTTPNIDSASVPTVSGTAPLYMARAWVNFNGTGTVAIRASGNVSSITDNGTGDYTLNFTTALSDANFTAVTTGGDTAAGTAARNYNTTIAAKATTSVEIVSALTSSGAVIDCPAIDVAIFR